MTPSRINIGMSKLKNQVIESKICSLPWILSYINLQNNKIHPCCRYNGPIGDIAESFDTVWQNVEYQKLRTDTISNHMPSKCSACDVPENTYSYKNFKSAQYLSYLDDVDTDKLESPKIIHLILGNTCNLACRMCTPQYSSRLETLSNQSTFLKNIYKDQSTSSRVDVSKLKGVFVNAREIIITGGEPLIDKDCEEVLTLIQQESQHLRKIDFTSNLTKLNFQLIDILASLKNVKVHFNISIDGPIRIHEYIRYGCNWQNIVDNLLILRQYKHFQFGVNATISALNLGYITELIDSLNELQQISGVKFTHVMPTPVLEPHMIPTVLPEEIRKTYLEKLNNYENKSTIRGTAGLISTAKDFCLRPATNYQLFKNFISEFDRLTNTQFEKVYPELITPETVRGNTT
jgi:sulfatase maturation enzyme AslB (radical SAM superfamily)